MGMGARRLTYITACNAGRDGDGIQDVDGWRRALPDVKAPAMPGGRPEVMNARLLAPAVCTVLAVFAASSADAQSPYPSKPVQLIVPYTAGGGADVVMRAVAQRLADAWGRNVI